MLSPTTIEQLLGDVLAELRLLRLDLAEQRSAADVRLGLLLRAARAALGGEAFTAAGLVELATARLSTRLALQAAVEAVAGGTKHRAKSVGRFLALNAASRPTGCAWSVCVRGFSELKAPKAGAWRLGQHPERKAMKLTSKELKQYSLARLASGERGLEVEISEQLARGAGLEHHTVAPTVPWQILGRNYAQRDMTATTAGMLIGAETAEPLDILQPYSVVARAGVTSVSGLVGDLVYPKQSSATTGYWLSAEDTPITESTPTVAAAASRRSGPHAASSTRTR